MFVAQDLASRYTIHEKNLNQIFRIRFNSKHTNVIFITLSAGFSAELWLVIPWLSRPVIGSEGWLELISALDIERGMAGPGQGSCEVEIIYNTRIRSANQRPVWGSTDQWEGRTSSSKVEIMRNTGGQARAESRQNNNNNLARKILRARLSENLKNHSLSWIRFSF